MSHKRIQHSVIPICCLAIAGGAWASDLTVKTGATAKAGTYGLEVAVGKTCTADDDAVIPDQTVGGIVTFEGCVSLTAADVDILSSGDVIFQAGDTIVLENGFSVASGANFTATLDQGLTGRAYVQDNSPSGEKLYRVRFYVDPSSLNPGSGGFEHFTAFSGGGTWEFDLLLEDSGANIALVVEARNGVGFSNTTAESSLPSTYFAIEFEWKASDAGMSNGYLDVWIDDVSVSGLSSLDNETRQIDMVRWGVVDGVTTASTGTMNLDEFVSQRSSTAIGTLP